MLKKLRDRIVAKIDEWSTCPKCQHGPNGWPDDPADCGCDRSDCVCAEMNGRIPSAR